ncbi:Transposable element Tc1 transposase [Folsomia candida]|uniref:Transposable element Tc1 transposase n=1 Tax=Folsomia candida TaxID=158441 RepID=A0A226CZ45_FOLCA|nr:Transposable element Tc1 transposase [Folsomia candida]
MDRHIILKIEQNTKLSAPVLTVAMTGECGLDVSAQLTRNRIHQVGFRGRSVRKKPFSTGGHIAKCFAWAKKSGPWTVSDWKRVSWSEETKINLFGADGVTRVWRKYDNADETKYC